MSGNIIFVLVMLGALVIGVLVALTSDATFSRREPSDWDPDYEGGFGSGYTSRPDGRDEVD